MLLRLNRAGMRFGGNGAEHVVLEERVEFAAIGRAAVGFHDANLFPADTIDIVSIVIYE